MELPLPAPVPNDQIISKLREALLAKGPESLDAAQWIVRAAVADRSLLDSARDWYLLAQKIERRASGSPAPTPTPSANTQDIVLELFQMVTQPQTDPDMIVKRLAQIAVDFPEQFDGAMQMAEAAPTPAKNTETKGEPPGILKPQGMAISTAVVGVGSYVTMNRESLSKNIDQLIAFLHIQHLPFVQFVGLVALFGLLGGFVYAYSTYDGSWIPGRSQVGEQEVFILGVFGKALAGAVASLLTYFLAQTSSAPDISNATVTLKVTGSTLVAAFLAGLAGANWITMKRDWPLLAKSVSNALKLPASPEAARDMNGSSLKSILETVHQATASTNN